MLARSHSEMICLENSIIGSYMVIHCFLSCYILVYIEMPILLFPSKCLLQGIYESFV